MCERTHPRWRWVGGRARNSGSRIVGRTTWAEALRVMVKDNHPTLWNMKVFVVDVLCSEWNIVS
jgi:hypothetical protein